MFFNELSLQIRQKMVWKNERMLELCFTTQEAVSLCHLVHYLYYSFISQVSQVVVFPGVF